MVDDWLTPPRRGPEKTRRPASAVPFARGFPYTGAQ